MYEKYTVDLQVNLGKNMWRSFFFAVGMFLFVGGLQCLIFEQYLVDQNNRVLAIAKRAGNAAKTSAQDSYQQLSAQPQSKLDAFSFGGSPSYYGGASQFQQAGYRNSPMNGVAEANPTGKELKAHRVKDWYPWCLLAVGTIVCLYTKSAGQPND